MVLCGKSRVLRNGRRRSPFYQGKPPMAHKNSEEEFNELVTSFFQGGMSRRRFIRRAAQLGLSAALVSQLASVSFASGDDILESSPAASNESPITRERVEY